jgi:hypothetical protein
VLDQAVLLGGYLLAHCAQNLSFVDEVKVLTPFSISLKDGKLHTKFHSGKTQAEAVATAKQELEANKTNCDAWAFAREGRFDDNGRSVETLSVSAWSTGMGESVIFIQRFERSPTFKLVGDPWIGIDDHVLDDANAKPILVILRKGISQHNDAGPKWDSWH